MNEWPKGVAIAAIWISVGMSLGSGLFKANISGEPEFTFFLLLFLTAMIIGGSLIATRMVCSCKSSQNRKSQDEIL